MVINIIILPLESIQQGLMEALQMKSEDTEIHNNMHKYKIQLF